MFSLSDLLQRIFAPGNSFWPALLTTAVAAALAETLGVVLGFIMATMYFSRVKPIRWVSALYTYVTRGVPAIVQIFFWYYGFGILIGFNIFPNYINLGLVTLPGALAAGIWGLGFAEGGYMREIFRGAIQAIEAGQSEAGASLGLTRTQITRHIVLPQAIRIMIPTIGNQFNSMLKITSILAFIGVYEIFLDAEVYYANAFRPVEAFAGVAVWYLVLTTLWNLFQWRLERRLDLSRRTPKPIEQAAAGSAIVSSGAA